MTGPHPQPLPLPLPRPPFDRVIGAVDGSGEAVEAAAQGWRLAGGCPLTLVQVIDPGDAPAVIGTGPEWLHLRRERAHAALDAARARLLRLGFDAPIDTSVEEGDPAEAFHFVSAGPDHKLLTMGSGEEAELSQPPPLPPPTLDRMSRRILEAASCSVLVARPAGGSGSFPASITVGFDGSEVGAHAYEVAASIAAATGASLRVVMADRGGSTGPDRARSEFPAVPIDEVATDAPEVALLKAGTESDLLVVGRRGVHGSRDLGSVSARVAAFSPVSVLVVHRPWAGPAHARTAARTASS